MTGCVQQATFELVSRLGFLDPRRTDALLELDKRLTPFYIHTQCDCILSECLHIKSHLMSYSLFVLPIVRLGRTRTEQ
jgi:hypothetical protein